MGHDAALNFYNSFLDYTLYSGDDNNMGSSIGQLGGSHTGNTSAVTLLNRRERKDGQRRKMYADTYAFDVTAAIEELMDVLDRILLLEKQVNYILIQLSILLTV